MAILDRTRMNLARQFLRTPAIVRPYIRSVLILERLKQKFVGSQEKTRLCWTKNASCGPQGR